MWTVNYYRLYWNEASEVLHLEHSFIWYWNLDASGSRSETPGMFRSVVLEKDGKDQLDRSCEKWRSITQSQGAEEYPAWNNKRKANWIGHILCRNCLLQRDTEGKIKGGIEVTWRRGRRRRKLLDDPNGKDRILSFEGRSSRSHYVESWLWKWLWTCRQTYY